MRSMRGLYVIRGGAAVPRLAALAVRADEPAGDAPADGRLGTLEVDFSRFDTWYEIDSFWEGQFVERIVRGAFKKTIRENGSNVKVLFNHGFDFHIGDKVLGVPEVLEERDVSPHLEAGLLDTSYNRDLEPGLRAGAYGSSFMFEVLAEKWVREPEKSEHNPDGLPERTITQVRLFEAGPVTWPANPDATASLRSGTDWYAEQVQLRRDREQFDELVRSFAAFRALNGLSIPEGTATPPVTKPETPASEPDSDRHVDGVSATARRRRLALIDMARR
jgi:hypothetical protein